MNVKELFDLLVSGVVTPEKVWDKKLQEEKIWSDILKFPVLPFVAIIAFLSAVLMLIFGYNIPFVGVVKPSTSDILLQAVGIVLTYGITIMIMSWVAAYLAGITEGINDQNRAILMLFLVSIPSLIGRVFSTLPSVGMLIAMGLGIYSIVLFYKAIPIFMKVPLEKRVRYFIFVAIASILVSVFINLTIGKMFQPAAPTVTNIEVPGFVLEK